MELQNLKDFIIKISEQGEYFADKFPSVFSPLLESDINFSDKSEYNLMKINNLFLTTMDNINNLEKQAKEYAQQESKITKIGFMSVYIGDYVNINQFYKAKNIFSAIFMKYAVNNPEIAHLWPKNEYDDNFSYEDISLTDNNTNYYDKIRVSVIDGDFIIRPYMIDREDENLVKEFVRTFFFIEKEFYSDYDIVKRAFVREGSYNFTKETENYLFCMAEDIDGNVRKAIAVYPDTPPELLIKLSKDEETRVRCAVAENPNTPPEILLDLLENDNYCIHFELSENPNTPVEALTTLSKDENEYIRAAVAKNPNTSPEVLTELSEDKYPEVRQSVAQNANTPQEVLIKLLKDCNTREIAARNPKMTSDILAEALNNNDGYAHWIATKNPDTLPEALIKLSEDKDWDIRMETAKNPNIPSEALVKLSDDDNYRVRQTATGNPNIPSEVLARLAKDEDYNIRTAIAENPGASPEILMMLANDENYYVHMAAADNKNTTPKMLATLAQSENWNAREAAARSRQQLGN